MYGVWEGVTRSVGIVLLAAALATVLPTAFAAGKDIGSGSGRGWVQLRGRILCTHCTLRPQRALSSARLYQLTHRLEQVVIQVNSVSSPLPYRCLWLKSADRVFETLTAEENLFKEVESSGLVREYRLTSAVLDLVTVQVWGQEVASTPP